MSFLNTHRNRIDGNGRVSVPASFRAVLKAQKSKTVVLYPSLRHPCIECMGDERMQTIIDSIEKLDMYSPKREQFETLLADANPLKIDGDGRIVIPPELIEHAQLKGKPEALFRGIGTNFQIWEPENHERLRTAMRTQALADGTTLSIIPRAGASK